MRHLLLSLVLSLSLAGPCWAGASRDFDGTNDNVDFGTTINNVDTFTYVIFANSDAHANQDVLLNKGTSLAGFRFLKQTTTTASGLRCFVAAATTNGVSITAANFSNTTDWFAFFCTYDNAGDRKLRIYKSTNGGNIIEATYNTQTAADGTITDDSTGNWRVGESQDGLGDWDGQAAYVMIYNRVLSNVEMNEVARQPTTIPAGRQLLAPFLGDSPEIDWSGNGISGTVSNSAASSNGPPVFLTSPQTLWHHFWRSLASWLIPEVYADDIITCDPTDPLVPNRVVSYERSTDPYKSGAVTNPNTLIYTDPLSNSPRPWNGVAPSGSSTDWKCVDTDTLTRPADGLLDAVVLMTPIERATLEAPQLAEAQRQATLMAERVSLETDVDTAFTNWTSLNAAQRLDALRKSMRLNRVERLIGQ